MTFLELALLNLVFVACFVHTPISNMTMPGYRVHVTADNRATSRGRMGEASTGLKLFPPPEKYARLLFTARELTSAHRSTVTSNNFFLGSLNQPNQNPEKQ